MARARWWHVKASVSSRAFARAEPDADLLEVLALHLVVVDGSTQVGELRTQQSEQSVSAIKRPVGGHGTLPGV